MEGSSVSYLLPRHLPPPVDLLGTPPLTHRIRGSISPLALAFLPPLLSAKEDTSGVAPWTFMVFHLTKLPYGHRTIFSALIVGRKVALQLYLICATQIFLHPQPLTLASISTRSLSIDFPQSLPLPSFIGESVSSCFSSDFSAHIIA